VLVKRQFTIKTDRNSIFLDRKTHILNRLYIMVLYIIFYRFKKNQISSQNAKVLVVDFTEKRWFVANIDRNSHIDYT
jgi:hypothetical protein